jgi:hypothetical protein
MEEREERWRRGGRWEREYGGGEGRERMILTRERIRQ